MLDALDREIVEILADDGRISNRNLARRVKLSDSACRERVRRLERIGAILGYRATINPAILRCQFEVWANISVENLPLSAVAALEALTERTQEVASWYTMTGAYDYIIRFVAQNRAHWELYCAELEKIGVGLDRVKFGIVADRRERAVGERNSLQTQSKVSSS